MRDFLQLFINGTQVRLADDWAFATLSEYLRVARQLTGTKVVCAEGDCGACSVLIGRLTADKSAFRYDTIDACIVFMHQLDQAHVVTVEGLLVSSLTSVQHAMVDAHGSQCGFCTPGFVMALHGMCEKKRGCHHASSELSDAELRLGLSGNLCRCTGYLQIIQAGRQIDLKSVPELNLQFPSQPMRDAIAALPDQSVQVKGTHHTLHVPRTIQEALTIRSNHPEARLVAGATDIGVWFNHGKPSAPILIDLNRVQELRCFVEDANSFTIGAGLTWTQLIEHFREPFPEFVDVLERFGSPQIRNIGTIAGNLVNASPIADSIPFFMVMDAMLTLRSVRGARTVSIQDFYQGYKAIDLRSDELVESIMCRKRKPTESLNLFKVSKRRDMDISTFTAAILLDTHDGTIQRSRIALGGVGPIVIRARNSEEFLRGKQLTFDVMATAGRLAREEVTPISDVRGSEQYRSRLVENVFVKCFYDQTLAPEVVA